MKLKLITTTLLTLLLLAGLACSRADADRRHAGAPAQLQASGPSHACTQPYAAAADALIPLKKGEVWTYRGRVETEGAKGKAISMDIEWKEEVLEVLKLGGVTAAVIKGHPDDLAFYGANTTKPGRYLLVAVENKKLYLLREDQCDEVLHMMRTGHNPKSKLANEDLIAQAPLKVHTSFGDGGDGRYQWNVDERSAANLRAVKLSDSWRQRLQGAPCFRLNYSCNGSGSIVDFVPGLGFQGYYFQHFGTVSTYDVHLVSFTQ